MALNCLAGCVSTYQKGDVGPRLPIDTENLMPWVEVTFTNSNKKISVSNYSSKNISAIIESFKFGMSSGFGVEIEIVDEAGGQFSEFFNRLSAGNLGARPFKVVNLGGQPISNAGPNIGNFFNPKSLSGQTLLQFRFGWATGTCDGNDSSNTDERINCGAKQRSLVSCMHTMIVRKIKADVSHGMFKYTIEGTDYTQEVMSTRVYEVYGTDKNPMSVTNAIRKMFATIGITVDFVQWDSSGGGFQPLQFRTDGKIDAKQGSMSTFQAMGTNPIQAAMEWLSVLVSGRGKGITWFWDSRPSGPVLVFAETSQISCDVNRNVDNRNLGTYVIGSKCSPVISFSPDIEYYLMDRMAQTLSFQSGALDGKMDKENSYEPKCLDNHPGILNQGRQFASVLYNMVFDIFRGSSGKKAADNRLETHYANLVYRPIKAELRVQGDPSYDRPIFCKGHFLSIVFIRPFVIGTKNGACDWLAQDSPCDNLLSSCKWMIDGVSHQISPGSFTTSLSVRLAAPNFDIPVDDFLNCG